MNRFMKRRIQTTLSSTSGAMTLEKRGVSRWDFNDPYHFALTLTWPEFFGVLTLAYITINLLFAGMYFAMPGGVTNLPSKSFADAFFFSVETLATVGYGMMAPTTLAGHLVSTVEIFVGMIFTATMTGLVFVRFSRPKAKIIFADQVVVTRHGGRETLMVRIGNARAYALSNGSARVMAVFMEPGVEGHQVRNAIDLKLKRQEMPFFPLTWTLMHDLDESSPLHGLSESTISEFKLHLMLNISAHDPALGSEVHAVHNYYAGDLIFGMRYADAVSWDGVSTSVADMAKISAIEPTD